MLTLVREPGTRSPARETRALPQSTILRRNRVPALGQTSPDVGAAAAENQVAVWIVDAKGGGASKAITMVRQMDLACNLHGPGEATVGIEGEELEGRIERPHARALPRPEDGRPQFRVWCVTGAGERAALMEQLEGTKSHEDIAVTIGTCHLRIPCAFQRRPVLRGELLLRGERSGRED